MLQKNIKRGCQIPHKFIYIFVNKYDWTFLNNREITKQIAF